MNLYINKKLIEKLEIKTGIFYQYVETSILDYIEIKRNNKCEIFITNNVDYFKEKIIYWNMDGLSNYYHRLNNGQFTFINCDMYDDYLEFKISIKKDKNKIYLGNIKHIINLEDIIFKK